MNIDREELFDNQKGVRLPDGSFCKVSPEKRKFRYVFISKTGVVTDSHLYSSPIELTLNSTVGKKIKTHLDPSNSLNNNGLVSKFEAVKIRLQDYLDENIAFQKRYDEEVSRKEQIEKQKYINQAMIKLDNTNNPLIWLGSLIDWTSAGERVNILISFLTFCSQVVLKQPTSLIGLGEGSSGKNHVIENAMSLIPDEFILKEKHPTLASMFRRSEIDPYYYDGKIVFYGDLGGETDQDDVKQTKDILKELQTDGEVNRPITVSTGDGFEVVDLCLLGNPCLAYTTVPNYSFEGQELSRSLIYTPRTDNRKEFNRMMSLVELVGSEVKIKQEEYLDELKCVPYMVYGLRDKFEDIEIINPFSEVIIDFIGDSEYFKRDFAKYTAILKVISCFNYKNKKTWLINGQEVMFVDGEDIQFFLSLFNGYKGGISYNLTPKAMEIFKDFCKHRDEWTVDNELFTEEEGLTVNQYMNKGNIKLSKRSIQRYFSELNGAGLLHIVDTVNRTNIYDISIQYKSIQEDTLNIQDIDLTDIKQAYGEEISQYIHKNSFCEKINIFKQHSTVEVTPW